MKIGKERIYTLPLSDVMTLTAYAQQLQREAAERGETLPPPVRLHVGEPSFRTPAHIREAANETIAAEHLTYAPPEGWLWLRELLVAKIARINGYSVEPDNIAITMGGTGALFSSFVATVNPGDEVLIPDPCWPHYYMQLASVGATPVSYPLDPRHDWQPDLDQLERLVTPRTRLLLINTPGNPTGAVLSPPIIRDLLSFARRHDLYLLSDECYDEIIFEGRHISPATMLEPGELESGRFIGVYTFSKTYAMTGWRIGYVVSGRPLLSTIASANCAANTSVSTIVQRAAAAALTGPQDCVGEMRAAYRRRRDLTVNLLKEHNRYLYTPHGAFYALIDISTPSGQPRDSVQFARKLLQTSNITVASGSGFGSVTSSFVRISLAAPETEIERGLHEICALANQSTE